MVLNGRRTDASRLLGETTRWPGTAAWIAADGKVAADPAAIRRRGNFVDVVLSSFGSPETPVNLLGGLFAASRDPRLAAQGFRSAGALGPNLSLWPKLLAEATPPPAELLLQRGHADRVTALAYSADGATMVTASMDSTIKIWRVADGVLLRTLPEHMIGVTALALSPDGTSLASGDGSGRVILWSLGDYRAKRSTGPSSHERGITKIAFAGTGSNFASIDLVGKTVFWTPTAKGIEPKELVRLASAIAAGGGRIAAALRTGNPVNSPFVLVFDSTGKLIRQVNARGDQVSVDAMAIDAERLAIGDKSGEVRMWGEDVAAPPRTFRAEAPIESVTLVGTHVVAGAGKNAWFLWSDPARAPTQAGLTGKAGRVSASTDGRSVVATTTGGDIAAWTIAEPGKITPIEIANRPDGPRATIAGFPPHGGRLVSGDQDGGIRSWEWPTGTFVSQIKRGGGKIEALAVAPDGRNLIQIDNGRAARVWDLREGRGLKTIPGQWISAAFLPDGSSVAMTSKAGDVSLIDPTTTARREVGFSRPVNANGKVITWGFGPVAVSPDGKRILAGSREGPIASVWPIAGGVPSITVRDHAEPISAVGFASDSNHWLTASIDGTAKIWSGDAKAPTWTLAIDPGDDPAVTAAAIAPGPIKFAVTGHRDGRLVLWTLGPAGKSVPVSLGQFDGEVRSLAFSSDGSRLIAGGTDKVVRLHMIAANGPAANAPIRLLPQHTEQVNAVVAWPNDKVLASAGDDGTIRFWKPDGSGSFGTVATFWTPDDEKPVEPKAAAGTPSENGSWVAYDPDGRFDSSPGGETRVTILQGGKVLTLDQFDGSSRIFGLGGLWLDGKPAEGIAPIHAKLPAGLAIDPPIPGAPGNLVELRVRLGTADATNLRLYQNEVPVRDEKDFEATDDPAVRTVKVELGAGENRFAAMASTAKPGAIFGRSNVVCLNGPPVVDSPKGSIHTLALGISKYNANGLQYATKDADSVTAFLKEHGYSAGRESGVTKLLSDDQVTTETVEVALREIRDACKPEDTVVIFMAGHTDVRRDDRFCLLLHDFPFAPNALEVGQRGPIKALTDVPEVNLASKILPYATIYRDLARMNARNRLVVIDACQAGAIFDDPAIQRIRRKVDDGAHSARTSYLLAARKGEAAKEASVLEHGLFTYLMLHGMGATGLPSTPGESLGNADTDQNGVVTTEELRQYLDVNLPILAERVDAERIRANPAPRGPAEKAPTKTTGATGAFPISRLPSAR